ncbi:hypothetical protein E4U21_000581 [Claviceps maximensis]|nr:hypothetical protein E4U21_000581 [Claviceps maximensis]
MGVSVGFDMVPRLSTEAGDRRIWGIFVMCIGDHFDDDPLVEQKSKYILFNVGEQHHPMLPLEGHKFLRFSSDDPRAEAYIYEVSLIATVFFGRRVVSWDEHLGQAGHYGWDEVHESVRTYDEADEMTERPRDDIVHSSRGEPLFDIRDVPGKGRGLIAREEIPRGTLVLVEKPLVVVPPVSASASISAIGEAVKWNIANQLRQRSRTEVRQFLSLHNNFRRRRRGGGGTLHPFHGIFQTNALPCGPGSSTGAVYATVSLINHSCRPNCGHSWDSEAEHETIYAIRDIVAGEEITITYLEGGSHAERAESLNVSFGFACSCELCRLSTAELRASDDRRARMKLLDRAIEIPLRIASQPRECLQDCRSLLGLLDEEYSGSATALHARTYYDAFQICIAHGDQARARIFAERSYAVNVLCGGEGNPETKSVKALALRPGDHPSFGKCSQRWMTSRNMVKRGVSPERFERWLWRE